MSIVKSMKTHLRKVVGETKLTFEELTTILCQVESCLNSHPLCTISKHEDDGMKVLTPGHFLIGQPSIVRTRYARFEDIATQALESVPNVNPKLLDLMVS